MGGDGLNFRLSPAPRMKKEHGKSVLFSILLYTSALNSVSLFVEFGKHFLVAFVGDFVFSHGDNR